MADNIEMIKKWNEQLRERYLNIKNSKQKKQTNADRIRSMNDEELAEFLINYKNTFGEEYEGKMSCLEWLQSEVKPIYAEWKQHLLNRFEGGEIR